MATTVAANQPPQPKPPASPPERRGLNLECLTHIDMTKLSQSELQALSLCSDSAFDVLRTDDVVVPHIDRSVFNESAGSRRQTYSRPRGGYHQHHHHHHRTRVAGLLPRPRIPPSSDPENHAIVHYLKHYLHHNSSSDCPPPPPPPPLPPAPPSPPMQQMAPAQVEQQLGLGLQEKMAIAVHAAERKRKRGRKAQGKANRGLLGNGVGMELERVNKKGEVVEFEALERNGDDLYNGELKRRTTGLETEEGVQDFVRGLEGEWCSRRKKRKYVDASEFGDALPIGWKLLLGLKRREGLVSVYCRRIVSPTGEQFLSCKEASSFLRSYFEGKNTNQPTDCGKHIIEQLSGVTSGRSAGFSHEAEDTKTEILSDPTLPCLTASTAQDSEVCLMDIENLPEVQVENLFECYKCNLTFREKIAYLEHLMSVHQRTTRTYKFGESLWEGVVFKDGKFECQFCHKVFQESCSYNNHLEIHVRNHGKGSTELPAPEAVERNSGSLSEDGLSTRTSKMNALIEIAQNSVTQASSAGFNSEAADNSCPILMNLNEVLAEDSNKGMILGPNPTQMEINDANSGRVMDQLRQTCSVADGKMGKSDHRQVVKINLESICTSNKELENKGNNETQIGSGNSVAKLGEDVANTKGLIGENIIQNVITSSSLVLAPSSEYFAAISNKGDDSFLLAGQKPDNMTGFEELGLDDMESFEYGFNNRQEPSSLPGLSMDLASDAGVEEGFNSSVGFDSEGMMLNMSSTVQVMTVCVWCRTEFEVETFETEPQSDSIGYMCPTCKDGISGHFDSLCP